MKSIEKKMEKRIKNKVTPKLGIKLGTPMFDRGSQYTTEYRIILQAEHRSASGTDSNNNS